MKLTDDFDEDELERDSGKEMPLIYMAVAVSCFILLILAIVLMTNKGAKKTIVAKTEQTDSIALQEDSNNKEKTIDELISGSKLTSDQLDIWDMMPSTTSDAAVEDNTATENGNKGQGKEEKTEEPDFSKDGNHTMIINDKGEEEWLTINPYLTQHKYDFSGLVYQEPVMKYYENSQKVSYMGVDLSKTEGYVDFNKLKKAGADFVMLRLGARGYGSGQLVLDENFEENVKGAKDAGLSIGVYFYSQAITQEEVLQEVEMIKENCANKSITYPIAFVMEDVANDTARIDKLSKLEKTKMASTFLKAIKEEGYNPILYGTKKWLLTNIDLMQLIEYDVWLAQEEDVPNYPYKFSMWQYTQNGKIEGIAGKANLNISFIDYELK